MVAENQWNSNETLNSSFVSTTHYKLKISVFCPNISDVSSELQMKFNLLVP